MPRRGLFRRPRRRGGINRDDDRAVGERMMGRRRHNHHGREPNPLRMLFYFVVIVFNLWNQRIKKLKKKNNVPAFPPEESGGDLTPTPVKNQNLEEKMFEERNEL